MQLTFPLHRAFLALPLEGEAKKHFQEVQHQLQKHEDLFRFQNPETAHLSLHFWQTLMEIEYGQILKQTEKIAARTQPFTLQVTDAGTFGDGNKGASRSAPTNRVLFLTIARCEDLARLKKLCPWLQGSPLQGLNLYPFSPHITLARMKNPNAFRVHQKKIMKLLKNVSFEIPCDRLRFCAEIEGVRQTPIEDFVFALR